MVLPAARLFEFIKREGVELFSGAHAVYTPQPLVEEILSQIDVKNKTILVLFNVEFVISLVHTYKVDPAMITLYVDHENKAKLAQRMGVNVITSLDVDMKFDVAVGNPPYQKEKSKAKRWTLWEEFVRKTKILADTIVMVTPQSITSPGTFNLIKDNATVINIDVGKHFNVGSTFCYWIADTTKHSNSTKIITDINEYNLSLSKINFLPSTITDETLVLINSLTSRNSRSWRRGELHTSNVNLFNENGKYSVMHTNAQTLKSNTEHPNKTKIRVAVTLSGYPTFRIVTNGYVSQACFWTECDTLQDAQALADECNGEEIQKILTVFKWSGWNSKEVIQCI